jgi:uncharacterized protein YndB with AHSA1/START domain
VPADVELSETIRATPERVFAYRRDIENLPEYNPDVLGLERVGEAYRFRVRVLGGMSFRTTLTVREAIEPTRIVFDIASIFDAREVCTFEPTVDGTRVRFTTHIDSPGGVFGRLVDRFFVLPNLRRQMAAELTKMKARLERA